MKLLFQLKFDPINKLHTTWCSRSCTRPGFIYLPDASTRDCSLLSSVSPCKRMHVTVHIRAATSYSASVWKSKLYQPAARVFLWHLALFPLPVRLLSSTFCLCFHSPPLLLSLSSQSFFLPLIILSRGLFPPCFLHQVQDNTCCHVIPLHNKTQRTDGRGRGLLTFNWVWILYWIFLKMDLDYGACTELQAARLSHTSSHYSATCILTHSLLLLW